MAYSVAVMRFRLEKAFFAVADFPTIQRHSSPTRWALKPKLPALGRTAISGERANPMQLYEYHHEA
jgi:hypothetical protein